MESVENIAEFSIADGEEINHLKSSTIMIVDDEPITMEVVQAFLEEEGYRKFVQVEHSIEAMRTLKKTNPDVLLLDLMMPEVSGFDILSEVRSHPKFKRLPVIILTSATDSESKLRALDMGATDFLAKPVDQSELGLRLRNTLAAKAYQDQLAYYDKLTKLPNRSLFMERFDWALKDAERYNEKLALMNIDLDNFDKFNDTIGIHAGDEILRQIAGRIEAVIRNSDMLGRSIGEEEAVMNLYRFDGSVFSLLIDRMHSTENAAIVADRILRAIREPMKVADTEVYNTASIGIATYPAESRDKDSLIRLASSAKDFVKNKGGDYFQYSSKAINAMYEKRLLIESRLRKALERDEFVLLYQPKVDIRSGTIQGVEALIRWKYEGDVLMSPIEFIPLAEETGLILSIGRWCLSEACRQLKEWQISGRTPISVSVNLSARQFEDPQLIEFVRKSVLESGIDPKYLIIELTESLLIQDVEAKIKVLNSFKDMGLSLSIDDFGTGYSSFSYLRKLPVDELKIDRSFIMELSNNSDGRAIVSSIIYLSNKLKLKTVAEGVESEEELHILREEECHQYQGYLFSRPITKEKLFELLPLRT